MNVMSLLRQNDTQHLEGASPDPLFLLYHLLPTPLSPSESGQAAKLQLEPCKRLKPQVLLLLLVGGLSSETAAVRRRLMFPRRRVRSRSSIGRSSVVFSFFKSLYTYTFIFYSCFVALKNYKYRKRSIIYKLHAFGVREITAREHRRHKVVFTPFETLQD